MIIPLQNLLDLREKWENRQSSDDEYDAGRKPILTKYETQFLSAEEELFNIGHDLMPISFRYLLQSEGPQPIDFELFGHLVDIMSTPEDLPLLIEA